MTDLITLGIDTSGKVAGVAITDNEKLLWEKSVFTRLTHSQVILPMVKQALDECELGFEEIDCVAAADGPGSYTGLRIGIGAVKGMCMGCESLKCAGVSTLLSLAYNCSAFCGKIISVMKARPKIVYTAEFISDGEKLSRTSEDRLEKEDEFFTSLDISEKIMLTGDYADEIKQTYFKDNKNVIVSPLTLRLQKASSLCMAVLNDESLIISADKLEVSYLQPTKAEKDKAHREQ